MYVCFHHSGFLLTVGNVSPRQTTSLSCQWIFTTLISKTSAFISKWKHFFLPVSLALFLFCSRAQQQKSRTRSDLAGGSDLTPLCQSSPAVVVQWRLCSRAPACTYDTDPVGLVPRLVLDVAEEQTVAPASDAASASVSLKKTFLLMPHMCCKVEDTDGSCPKSMKIVSV